MPRGQVLFALALGALAASTLGGCGRRGPLEPPSGAAVPPPAVSPAPAAEPAPRGGRALPADRRLRPGAAAPASASPTTLTTGQNSIVEDAPEDALDEDDIATAVTPTPTPRRRARAFVVPKEPFILDPLL